MKAGWELKQLGRVCKVVAGQSPEGQFYNTNGIGLPFFQGKKDFQEKYIAQARVWTSNVTKEAQAGDILMSVRAPVGPINFAIERCCIGRGLAAIRVENDLDADYLYYALLSKETEISGSEGAVFASINKSQIEGIVIPIPPLEEQRRIVAVLDKAFAGIATATANAQKNLTNARALFESVLDQIFEGDGSDWNAEPMNKVCIIGDGNHSSKYPKNSEMVPFGVPFLRSTNIQDGKISLSDVLYISPEKHRELKKGHLKTGDVLFTNRGEIGKLAIIGDDLDGANLNSQIAWLRSSAEILPQYLFFYLQSGKMKKHYQRLTEKEVG